MYAAQVKLADIAAQFGITSDELRRYLHDELLPLQASIVLKGKEQQIISALLSDNNGVYFYLLDKTAKANIRPVMLNDYVGQTLEGITTAATEQGYHVLARFTHRELASHEYFHDLLTKYPNSGLLALIPQVPETIAEVCAAVKRPCLIIDYRAANGETVHTLNVNNQRAVEETVHGLIQLGHQRIAYITGDMAFSSAQERLTGYQNALYKAGIPLDFDLIAHGNWSRERAAEVTPSLLRCGATAIVCANDMSALGCYATVQEAGLSIPGDISITGFDDIDMVANINPPLTTVRQSMRQLGRHAANLLIDIMEGGTGDTDAYDHTFPLEVVWRGSTGRAKR